MTNKVGPTGRLQCISAACHGRHADGRPLKPCGSTTSHGEPLRGTTRQGAKARASLSRGRAGARSVSRRNRERASSIQQRPSCRSCSHGGAGALVRDKSLTQAHHADESAASTASPASPAATARPAPVRSPPPPNQRPAAVATVTHPRLLNTRAVWGSTLAVHQLQQPRGTTKHRSRPYPPSSPPSSPPSPQSPQSRAARVAQCPPHTTCPPQPEQPSSAQTGHLAPVDHHVYPRLANTQPLRSTVTLIRPSRSSKTTTPPHPLTQPEG
jgi:hypothetical protein